MILDLANWHQEKIVAFDSPQLLFPALETFKWWQCTLVILGICLVTPAGSQIWKVNKISDDYASEVCIVIHCLVRRENHWEVFSLQKKVTKSGYSKI